MRKEQHNPFHKLTIGVCYYPEQWPEANWASDLRRMTEAGIRVVRVGEFGWSLIEKREGEFTFDLYDRFLAAVAGTPLRVIFGTPTATPPAWLTEKYPEVLNCRQDGAPYRHGMRRHYTYNSPIYRKLCARIVERLGEHFGQHPSIIGWQIDNELNCETADFYSESDDVAFREWVREKYRTLDALNEAWGTEFWSQTYSDWAEVHFPRLTIHPAPNPHQRLDYIRFVSDSAIGFCKLQSDILRRYIKPGDFITTNGLFPALDNHRLTDETLDFYSYDSYPNFAYCMDEDPRSCRDLLDRRWSEHLTETRSISPRFAILEQQTGAMGWHTRMESPAPKPGQLTLWAMQSFAHGADLVSFFRWRTAVFGTEMYWHGILDYDGRDNRRLREVAALSKRVEKLGELAGSAFRAAFALLRDYDNVWDADVDKWHRRIVRPSEKEIFVTAQLRHTPMDYLYFQEETEVEELLRYPVLIYPHPLILTQRRAALLTAYVEQGGTLLVGARTGQKDLRGHCVPMPMPGLLLDLTGTTVEDFTFVGPGDEPVSMTWYGEQLDTGIFNDVLCAKDATILARYAGSWYKGEPALTERRVGKGRVLHFGGTFNRENLARFWDALGLAEPWADIVSLPADCELCVREKDGIRYFIVLNFTGEERSVVLHRPLADMENGQVAGDVTLAPYEVKVWKTSL